ncbi:hypothetical protein IMCC14465_15600 [alpha proteobacterium IMCC14465]|uniref:Arsenate reductase n=1 Tax=alpha proteobacterium IMCC14465 TaxID=1220535 RepID=J9DEW2_9PROT|nr:hypothetical protein IMCC14465_15600 [alpha proteobacterium IMCC14465]
MLNVYGLKNCDTCRKALSWLQSENIAHQFFDIRKDGFTETDLKRWLAALGHEQLINRRGTSWRNLDAAVQESLSEKTAAALVLTEPALMKRPIFDDGNKFVICGFKAEQQDALKSL